MRLFHTLLSLGLMAALAACAPVKKVNYAQGIANAPDAHPAPIGWSGLKVRLPTGKDIGTVTHSGALTPGCALPVMDADRSVFTDAIDSADLKESFQAALESQGYDVAGSLDFQFPEDFEDEEMRAEYKIGGRVTDVQINACYTEPSLLLFSLNKNGYVGKLYMKIDWSLYDALHRQVVYKTTTEGYSERSQANREGVTLMINDAFSMAAHNLAADPQFHDLIFNGTKPLIDGIKKAPSIDAPQKFDPDEGIVIENKPLKTGAFDEPARKSAVMVQTALGHASGVFITPQGHILTNAHVVGDAKRLRVVAADKEVAMVAEVLRKNKAMDVALLRLVDIPKGFKIEVPPVRAEWPKVSEDVYVVGAPIKSSLQDSVMKGIVSAHRKNYKFNGARMDLIQADLTILDGDSGGPLFDASGNLVGLADASYITDSDENLSLNLFIPIAEALKYLRIDLQDAP